MRNRNAFMITVRNVISVSSHINPSENRIYSRFLFIFYIFQSLFNICFSNPSVAHQQEGTIVASSKVSVFAFLLSFLVRMN